MVPVSLHQERCTVGDLCLLAIFWGLTFEETMKIRHFLQKAISSSSNFLTQSIYSAVHLMVYVVQSGQVAGFLPVFLVETVVKSNITVILRFDTLSKSGNRTVSESIRLMSILSLSKLRSLLQELDNHGVMATY